MAQEFRQHAASLPSLDLYRVADLILMTLQEHLPKVLDQGFAELPELLQLVFLLWKVHILVLLYQNLWSPYVSSRHDHHQASEDQKHRELHPCFG